VVALHRVFFSLLTLGLLAMPATGRAQAIAANCDPSTPYAEVEIDGTPRVQPLEIASTEPQREQGLMYRQSLDPDGGMVFIYDQQSDEGYWMHNTYVPLSIAWIDQNGTIVDLQDMQPLTDTVHMPAAPYWYALEVNQGWFAQHGVGIGQQVVFCLPQPAN
jgi:uncharacterized membrane protein (UPF0127 family)